MATPESNADAKPGKPSTRTRHARLTAEQETSSEADSGHVARTRASCRPPVGARDSATSRYLVAGRRRDDTPLPHTPVHSHQDMLARITREITATEDLQAVLSSVAMALASLPDMIFSRVWLYLSDDRCDWCRTHGRPIRTA